MLDRGRSPLEGHHISPYRGVHTPRAAEHGITLDTHNPWAQVPPVPGFVGTPPQRGELSPHAAECPFNSKPSGSGREAPNASSGPWVYASTPEMVPRKPEVHHMSHLSDEFVSFQEGEPRVSRSFTQAPPSFRTDHPVNEETPSFRAVNSPGAEKAPHWSCLLCGVDAVVWNPRWQSYACYGCGHPVLGRTGGDPLASPPFVDPFRGGGGRPPADAPLENLEAGDRAGGAPAGYPGGNPNVNHPHPAAAPKSGAAGERGETQNHGVNFGNIDLDGDGPMSEDGGDPSSDGSSSSSSNRGGGGG